jgi:diacylglycerol kinase (ATP)
MADHAMIIHNPSAGDGQVAGKEVRAIVRGAGYKLDYRSTKDGKKKAGRAARAAAVDGIDLVVAAGGDGTVRRAAVATAGTGVPVAILPLGTANNLAKALRIVGPLRDLAAGWQSARRRPFDLGRATGEDVDRPFLESVGSGPFVEAVKRGKTEVERAGVIAGRETDRSAYVLRELAKRASEGAWTFTIDGQEERGDFVGFETLNIPFAGPNVPLAEDADPSDGHLHVVLLGLPERDRLVRFLTERLEEGAAEPLDLAARPAAALTVEAPPGAVLRVDGHLVHASRLELSLDPGAVTVLA